MEASFWLERWRANQIGFHQSEFNARLIQHWPALGIPAGAQVFVPLCGKSRDLIWLAQAGYRVVGVELAPLAVAAFFENEGAPSTSRQCGELVLHEGAGIEIYCGDFFALTADHLDHPAGVFDRGALVALPPPMRKRYVAHLMDILPRGASILLLALEYDARRVGGPPFSVAGAEVEALYGDRCAIEHLETVTDGDVPPHIRQAGIDAFSDHAYRIVKER